MISRQGLVDSIWLHYVTARFGRTGDPRALDYLYPYLAKAATRHQAVRVARDVFVDSNGFRGFFEGRDGILGLAQAVRSNQAAYSNSDCWEVLAIA